MIQIPDIVIAIDGYSSCGKSTLAKQVAKHLSYAYIDTGAMYRAVTLYALRNKAFGSDGLPKPKIVESLLPEIDIDFKLNEQGLNTTLLNDEVVEQEIRSLEVSNNVSNISTIAAVRTFLVAQQQKMGAKKRVVLDGRDIGTVVFPNAEFKLFMTASVHVRAKRRYDEMKAAGKDVSMEEIEENISTRDRIDTTRDISPLRQAEDAILLDNGNFTREAQLKWVLDQLQQKFTS